MNGAITITPIMSSTVEQMEMVTGLEQCQYMLMVDHADGLSFSYSLSLPSLLLFGFMAAYCQSLTNFVIKRLISSEKDQARQRSASFERTGQPIRLLSALTLDRRLANRLSFAFSFR